MVVFPRTTYIRDIIPGISPNGVLDPRRIIGPNLLYVLDQTQ